MTGTRNLSAPHTPLVIILPVSACSHRMYAPGKAAFSHFSMPSKGVWGFAPRLSPALDLHRACAPGKLSPYAVRSTSCGGHTRIARPCGLSAPHTPLTAGLTESKCSSGLCQPCTAFQTRMTG